MSADDNIAVAIRVRPVIKTEEKKKQTKELWKVEGNEILAVDNADRDAEVFTFDYIFGTQSTNADLFQIVEPLVYSALNGFNATIFAYGQTSSGKTHSILGNNNDPGIIPRSAQYIFNEISNKCMNQYIVRISYVEIYQEKFNDLLNVTNENLKLSITNDGKSILTGMHEEMVHNEKEMMAVIARGSKNRQIGETKMNERSSRSHVICDILIESSEINQDGVDDENDMPVKIGHLYIVDLAGSERISDTGATGTRKTEGVSINKSLSVLISVITQLSNGQSYVSYRDSKLTMMLANALSGNSRTLIIAAITPVSSNVSLSTLRFARSAKTIKTKPRLNEVVSKQSIIKRQQAREKELIQELTEQQDLIKKLSSELTESRKIYVPARQIVPKAPPRRHTMGAPSDLQIMEPIIEQMHEEDEMDKDVNNFNIMSNDDDQESSFTKENLLPSSITSRRLDYSDLPLLEPTVFDSFLSFKNDNHPDVVHKAQYQDLVEKFSHLDQSHRSLKEFTSLEFEIQLQERTEELQKEIQRIKEQYEGKGSLKEEYEKLQERYNIMKAEQEFIQNSQQEQLQRRCNELLSRIQELESENAAIPKIPLMHEDLEDRKVKHALDNEKYIHEISKLTFKLDELTEKYEKLEAGMKLSEMQSKMLIEENSALKGYKTELIRSNSDTNLADIKVDVEDPSYPREDFQNVFKSLRKLTSTIISGTDAAVPSSPNVRLTPMKINQTNSLGRLRPRSGKHSFVDRMTDGLQEEEIEKLRKENVMLSEHMNELLAKLKTVNDKMNDRGIPVDVGSYEERITSLEKEKSDLEFKLNQEGIDKDKQTYFKELENKIKQLEQDLKDYDVLIQTNNLEKAKLQEEIVSLTRKYQQCLDQIQLLKSGKMSSGENEEQGDLIDKLKQQIIELEKQLKQTQHEHYMDKEALEYNSSELDEAMVRIRELQTEVKTIKINHSEIMIQHGEQVKEVEMMLDKCKEDLSVKQDLVVKLEHELKLSKDECSVNKLQVQASLHEVEETTKKFKELQQEFDELQQKLGVLQQELQCLKQGNCDELLSVKTLLREKEDLLVQKQVELDETNLRLREYKAGAEVTQNNLQSELEGMQLKVHEFESKIVELNKEIDLLKCNGNENNDELLKLNQLVGEKQNLINTLQDELNSSQCEFEKFKTSVGDTRLEHEQEINSYKLKLEALVANESTNKEEFAKVEKLIIDKDKQMNDLQVELDGTKQEFHQHKLAAIIKLKNYEEQIELLQKQIAEVSDKNKQLEVGIVEKVKLIENLEVKLKDIDELTLKNNELQAEVDGYREHGQKIDKQIPEMVAMLNEKIEFVKQLEMECEKHREESYKYKMAADTNSNMVQEYEKEVMVLKENYNDQIASCKAKLKSLEEDNSKLQELSLNISELQEEIVVFQKKSLHYEQEILKMKESLREKDEQIKQLEVLSEKQREECDKFKMAANTNCNMVQEHEKEVMLLKEGHNFELESCKAKLTVLQQEVVQLTQLQTEVNALTAELTATKNNHVCVQKDYENLIVKMKENENVIASLKESQTSRLNLDEVNEKYTQALAKIASLEEEVKQGKALQDMYAKMVEQEDLTKRTLGTLSDEEKIKRLLDELHKKKYLWRLEFNKNETLKKDLDLTVKARDELTTKLEAVQNANKEDQRKLNEKIVSLKENLKQSQPQLKAAKETIRILKESEANLLDEVKGLKLRISTLDSNLTLELEKQVRLLKEEQNLELEACKAKISLMRQEIVKVSQLQSEIDGLKRQLVEAEKNNVNELNKKYSEALSSIEHLQEEVKQGKALKDTYAKMVQDKNLTHRTLSTLSDEVKDKQLLVEVHRKQKDLDLVVKARDELITKLEAAQILNKEVNSQVNEIASLKAALNRSHKRIEEAEDTVRVLKEREVNLLADIKSLKSNLVSTTGEYNKQYNILKQQFDNNNPNSDIVNLKSNFTRELQAKQKAYDQQAAAMTEDFERKYRVYTDKYAKLKKTLEMTTRQKDGAIKDLQSELQSLQQCNKENKQQLSSVGALEANKVEANYKRKIIDLQQQLQVVNQELKTKTKNYELQMVKLQDECQAKVKSMQPVEQTVSIETLQESMVAMQKREKIAKAIDKQLASISSKLSMINKINSIELVALACDKCACARKNVASLEAKCMEHPTWRMFDVITSGDKQISTTRFDLLTQVRDFFVKLLENLEVKKIHNLIMLKLPIVNHEINEYLEMFKQKKMFLTYLQDELNSTKDNIGKGLQQNGKRCQQCDVFKDCFEVVCSLSQKIKYSLLIIEQLENDFEPLQFSLDNENMWDGNLEKLMARIEEHTSVVIKQKLELEQIKQKYKRAKSINALYHSDMELMKAVLFKENYSINFDATPTEIVKNVPTSSSVGDGFKLGDLEGDNPRPVVSRVRETGRKSFGATPKHFSAFFSTPDDLKEAKHQARRQK